MDAIAAGGRQQFVTTRVHVGYVRCIFTNQAA